VHQPKQVSIQNGPRDSSKVRPHPEKGVGSTAGAMADGIPAAEGGLAAAKRQKTAGGKVPRVSSNLDGARRRTNPPRLATAKAAAGAKGLEVIPLDNDNEFSDEGTSSTMSRPRKAGHTTPGKATKLLSRRLPPRQGISRSKGRPHRLPSRWMTTMPT
jgi:hypothetical protein